MLVCRHRRAISSSDFGRGSGYVLMAIGRTFTAGSKDGTIGGVNIIHEHCTCR